MSVKGVECFICCVKGPPGAYSVSGHRVSGQEMCIIGTGFSTLVHEGGMMGLSAASCFIAI